MSGPLISMKMTGFNEVESCLLALPLSVQKATITRALMRAGERLARAARTKAPRDSGFLQESIGVSSSPPEGRAGSAAFSLAMRSGLSKQQAGQVARAANSAGERFQGSVWVGPSKRAAHAWSHEVGTYKMPAHPYLRPAFAQTQDEITDIMTFELWDAINRATLRYAKRIAKGAAK